MLSSRYENDGKPTLRLNSLQSQLCSAINGKIDRGEYTFEDQACAVCGGASSKKLAEKDRYGLFLPVVICRDCGLIYTNPRMTQDSYAAFYDCEYRQLYNGKEHPIEDLFQANLQRGQRISTFLRRASVEVEGKRVLEVGCGAGGILAYLRDNFRCEVKGCDYGSRGVEYGARRHGLDLEVGALGSIVLPWKPDIIIYSHVLEHILSIREECAIIHEALEDDGTVYIEVPSVKGIRQNYDWDFLKLLQNAHTYHFTLTTLTNLMNQCGFELRLGDEFTRSAFQKSSPRGESSAIVNDYDSVMRFLISTEQKRAIGAPLSKLLRRARRLMISCLKRLGLAATAQKILKE